MTFQLIVKAMAEEDIAFGRDFYHDIRPKLARDYLYCLFVQVRMTFKQSKS